MIGKRALVVSLIACAYSVVLAVPAVAIATPVTTTITGGDLSIVVPTTTVSLGTVAASASPQVVSAQLGAVTVTDNRAGTAGWTATADGVDFTGPQNISVSASGSSHYTAPPADVVGTANVANNDMAALYPPQPVQAATGVNGVNTATWNPTISLTLPGSALAGTYNSTITHSVS